jgi:hypothetical protein
MAIKLGSLVKDNITGFEGVATSRVEYLNGCVHVQIQPKTVGKDGKPTESQYFDEQRVELVKENVFKASKSSSATSGGPASVMPPRMF